MSVNLGEVEANPLAHLSWPLLTFPGHYSLPSLPPSLVSWPLGAVYR
jgi:hypothetical protein